MPPKDRNFGDAEAFEGVNNCLLTKEHRQFKKKREREMNKF